MACGRWSTLRKHIGPGKFYSKCIYRRVDFERNDSVIENVETFLGEADK